MDQFYFNFYFFGSLNACLFSLYVSLFFLTLKGRSKAAFHLGLSTIAMTLYHFGYMLAFVSYETWTIYHRLFAIVGPLMGFVQCFIFFFYFPGPKKVNTGLTIYGLLYLGIIAISIAYMIVSLNSVQRFVMGSDYWDFETYQFYKIFAIIILGYNLSFISSAVWRAIVEKGPERRWIIYIALAYSTITVVPGILNALSRDGLITRKVFQNVVSIAMVAGLFMVLIVYANATKEKTTILSKIVAVTLATFLLAFQLVGYIILSKYDISYDQIKAQAAQLAVFQGQKPDSLSYIISFDPKENKFNTEKGEKDSRFDSEDRQELRFFNVVRNLTGLGSMEAKQRWEISKKLLSNAPKEFYAYEEGLRQFLESKGNSKVTDKEVASFFRDCTQNLNVVKSRFLNLPSKTDARAVGKLLSSDKIGLSGILSKVNEKVQKEIESGKSPLEIRTAVIIPLSPIREVGERIYRGTKFMNSGDKLPQFYVSYLVVNSLDEKIYEVGFDYRSLRAFIHEPSFVLVSFLLIVMFTISFGFRYFFHNAFVKPMEEVVVGLTEVNSGNFEYRLTPRVEDEIGFIARSFNRMARSIQAARKRLEQYANGLEEKVKERTKELEQTLGEVQELKRQQDGDYFLTSLLIKPLGANRAIQENVKVDFLMEQKKKFTFRKYHDEIGGDLNISNRIQLQGRSYTVFLNGDAMGKSMQGAGGALVLGAVFESIIERTKLVESMKELSPERWLKNAFIELHKVFESFDGSMLVSSVIGLVDDEIGILYFLNAEHPWTVLYRDGIASFIENEFMFRKLGTTGMEGSIFIKTFQLEPGDVIFAGSDGRDDIIVGTDADGDRIINDDELVFLRTVEEAKGDLNEIYRITLKKGLLSDDLSLIRLSFKAEEGMDEIEDEKKERVRELLRKARNSSQNKDIQEAISYLEEAEALDSRIPEVKKNFVKLFLKLKDYSQAVRHAEDYISIKPIDSEILYVASFAARKAGKIHKALDFAERLKLREPDHFKNLLNLSEIFIVLKNYSRAASSIHAALKIEPENETALRISAILKKHAKENGKGV
ncbi:stage II sporulation protein E [Leptospira perolatii]|uniref:Stage II sporulation protein E n=1 Tax=Leptospira perolatii TaxID=2023191 RepID=A0A2M9ZJW3_9LEPT|nr:SpoIIE family protein phosphatase [Leptospira perolatii]PJZ69288.1 stage II sporulation protein E [Leptospira perolatii]PJZ72330.1 stage II sporulation protein E [Leptospira perolatii]